MPRLQLEKARRWHIETLIVSTIHSDYREWHITVRICTDVLLSYYLLGIDYRWCFHLLESEWSDIDWIPSIERVTHHFLSLSWLFSLLSLFSYLISIKQRATGPKLPSGYQSRSNVVRRSCEASFSLSIVTILCVSSRPRHWFTSLRRFVGMDNTTERMKNVVECGCFPMLINDWFPRSLADSHPHRSELCIVLRIYQKMFLSGCTLVAVVGSWNNYSSSP
jgi:hypothetical protein